MREVTISISISTQDYLAHYQGSVKEVVARSIDGRNIRFPSTILQPFVSHNGINGNFVISFDDNNKFQSIRKVG
jgi:hypothetical protein